MTKTAIDIESCTTCPHLIFPGEQVTVSTDGYSHVEHTSNTEPILASVA